MAEMVDETMESLDDEEEELDEEANEEIEKVLFDITNGKLGEVGGKVGAIPVSPLARARSLVVTNKADIGPMYSFADHSAVRSRGRGVRGNAETAGCPSGTMTIAHIASETGKLPLIGVSSC